MCGYGNICRAAVENKRPRNHNTIVPAPLGIEPNMSSIGTSPDRLRLYWQNDSVYIYVLISISEKLTKKGFHYYPLQNLKVECIMELRTLKNM